MAHELKTAMEKAKDKKIRKEMLEEKRKEFLKHKKKMKEGYEIRDVEGKVIPRRGPHSTFEGRLAERRRGYILYETCNRYY